MRSPAALCILLRSVGADVLDGPPYRLSINASVGATLAVARRSMHLVTLCRGRRPRRPAQAWYRSPWRASGGSLSFSGERKGGKNAAKTNGFGFFARAWCGMYRDLSAPRIKRYKPALCFRIAFCAYPPRRAPRLCCLSKQGSPLRLPAGGAEPRPYEALSLKQCVGETLAVARRSMHLVTLCRGRRPRRPAQGWHRSPWRASGGSLSFCGERKGGKNAAKTNGFGFLARAWCGMHRDLSAPRIKRYKPALCFRIVFCAYPPRRAPRLCCLSKQGSPLRLPAGGA